MSNLVIKRGTGASLEDAKSNVDFNFDVRFDATVKFKRAKEKAIENGELDFSVVDFAKAYLEEKLKSAPNVGVVVVLDRAVEDSRTRPYKEDVVVTTQRRKWKTVYQLVNDNNEIVLTVDGTKDEARTIAKELVKERKERIRAEVIKVVSEGEALAFSVDYTPSKHTKDGSYIFFALED